MKLTEAVELFYKVNRPPLISERTAETHHNTLDRNFMPFMLETFGELCAGEITRDQVRAFQEHLLTRKRRGPGRKELSVMASMDAKQRKKEGLLSLWTVRHYMNVLKHFFNWLVEEGILDPDQSPMLGVKMVDAGDTAAGAIPREAIVNMMRVAFGPPLLKVYEIRDQAIETLMFAPGPQEDLVCGSGELSRLKLEDIDGRRLHLRALTLSNNPVEVGFDLELTAVQEQALIAWLQVRPTGFENDHVFIALDNRGGKGAGASMSNRAVYSAYFKEKNLTAAQRQSRAEEIERTAVWSARRLALLLFFIDTGARLGGVMGLTHARLDLEARRAVVLEKFKGGPKVRTVFFSAYTAAALKQWLRLDNRENKDTVFGMRGNEFRAGEILAALAEQAGVKGVPVNAHSFRHSFARFLLEGGADLSQTSRLMGHRDISTTARFYIHWDMEKLAEVHEKASPVSNLTGKLGAADGGVFSF